jgi:hypothetical protein
MMQRSGILGIALAAALASVLAACGGGGYTTQRIDVNNSLIITVPGGSTTLSIVAPASGQFSVSEPGYTGAFTASSANRSIAVIGLASVFASARRGAAAETAAAAENSVTFTVVGTGNGTTAINVSDSLGHTASLTVIVSGFGPGPSPTPIAEPILASPETIALTAVAQSQGIVVSESGYNGTFTATSSNAAAATVSPASGATSFIVTAVAAGATTITFTDANNATTTVTVTVTTGSGTVSMLQPPLGAPLGPQTE